MAWRSELAVPVVDGVVERGRTCSAARRRPCRCRGRPRPPSSSSSRASGSGRRSRTRFVTLWAPSGPSGKRTRSPGASSCSPSGSRRVGAPGEHDQPLLLGVLVVVRADALARVELVDRPAELLGADRARRSGPSGAAVAGRVALVARSASTSIEVARPRIIRRPSSRPRRRPEDPPGRAHADLAAVRVLGASRASGSPREQHRAGPPHLMAPPGPGGKQTTSPRAQDALAVGRPQRSASPSTTSTHSSIPWWKWKG